MTNNTKLAKKCIFVNFYPKRYNHILGLFVQGEYVHSIMSD